MTGGNIIFGSTGGNIIFGSVARRLGQQKSWHAHCTRRRLRRDSLKRECKGKAPECEVWSDVRRGYKGNAVDTNGKLYLRYQSSVFHGRRLYKHVYRLQWSGILVCS